MKITWLFVASYVMLAFHVSAQPWIPADCKVRHEAKWDAFAELMRKANPGSKIYAPKPFPKNETEVVEDFKYGYRQMMKGMTNVEIPQEERPLYSGLEKNTLSYRIIRVENWEPDRCRPDRQRDFYYVIFIQDNNRSGNEIGRAFLNQNGLLSGWVLAPPGAEAAEPQAVLFRAGAAPRFEDVLTQIHSRFGIAGSRPQFVTTWGSPRCPLPSPCVALRADGRSYLYRMGELVELTSGSRVYTGAEMEATRTRRFEITSSINPAKEWLVSIADDRWVVAPRITPIGTEKGKGLLDRYGNEFRFLGRACSSRKNAGIGCERALAALLCA